MERQEASDVAIVDSLVTRRSLLKRTGSAPAAASRSLPLRDDLIRRSITDE
jgi:hypothetical protein